MKRIYSLLAILALTAQFAHAQLTLDGEFRPRTEYRHGFGDLMQSGQEAGFATSNRLRLNTGFKTDAYKVYVSLQDVFVWGENRQLKPNDENNSFAIFEAYADIKLDSTLSTKVGRQMLIYDDHRILGSVGWAQQARSHDAALLKYAKGKVKIDLGLAFNQDFNHPTGHINTSTEYTTTGFFSYKSMQFLHANIKGSTLSTSFLFMNNGFQNYDTNNNPHGTQDRQTLGTHLKYKKGSFGATLNAYVQMGDSSPLNIKGAYLLGLDLSYKTSDKVSLGLGAEIISGDDATTTGKNEAFFPLYGTNHKFNGFMDYFYVGNHANNVGLVDLHASIKAKVADKTSIMLKVLNFSSEQDLSGGENSLGTEVDFVLTQKFNGYALKLGYSQMFVSDGMYDLKNPDATKLITTDAQFKDSAMITQNWGWAMLIIKPKFLDTTPKKAEKK